jgi:hypothetical protein
LSEQTHHLVLIRLRETRRADLRKHAVTLGRIDDSIRLRGCNHRLHDTQGLRRIARRFQIEALRQRCRRGSAGEQPAERCFERPGGRWLTATFRALMLLPGLVRDIAHGSEPAHFHEAPATALSAQHIAEHAAGEAAHRSTCGGVLGQQIDQLFGIHGPMIANLNAGNKLASQAVV